jgi:hypothetical protein
VGSASVFTTPSFFNQGQATPVPTCHTYSNTDRWWSPLTRKGNLVSWEGSSLHVLTQVTPEENFARELNAAKERLKQRKAAESLKFT